MQYTVYILFICIFLLDFLGAEMLIPRYATYGPELISIGLLLAILFSITSRRVLYLSAAYLIILFFIVLEMLFGVILNNVAPTTLVAGLRNYFKFIPFFFLPAVFLFSSEQIRKQLQFLCLLTIMQLPIALYQRLVIAGQTFSGDAIKGTLSASSLLSIYLICASIILTAFYLKKRISKPSYFLLLLIFLIPTTINETKGTLFLLPFGLILPIIFLEGIGEKIKRFILIGVLGTVFVAAYIPVYNHFTGGTRDIVEFFTEGGVESYLAPGLQGEEEKQGRVDLIIFAVTELSDDFTQLMLGVGIGNISPSFLGEKFDGAYLKKYRIQYLSLAQLIWEIGILGTLMVFILWLKITLDAIYMSRRNDQIGALSLGWIGIMGVMFLALSYKNMIIVNTGYLFWFYSGYIISERVRMMRKLSDDTSSTSRIVPGQHFSKEL